MSENKSLESQALAANDASPKFLGVSLIFHALLVLIVVYLNYPAIKQKFNPEPESVAVEIKEPAPVTNPAPTEEKAPEVAKPEAVKVEEKISSLTKPPQHVKAKTEKALQKARIKIAEFKDEETLTTANIRTPAKSETKIKMKEVTETKPKVAPAKKSAATLPLPQKKATTAAQEEESEVLVPKATITEISEVPVNDDGTPLPNIADEVADSSLGNESLMASTTAGTQAAPTSLQQMARSELTEETIEENTTSSFTEIRQATPGLSRPAPTRGQIRAVTALQQRPGNPLPKYSDFERLRRHEGQVTYLAYVTSSGRLTDFILEESSGHPNLDQKTLAALKNWRFVEGQEGWVEIPQVWILSGEAEQLPSQLRR